MAEFNSPVSFIWNKSFKKDGIQNIYCFAYVRNIETNEILYAGVKYVGNKEKFGKIKRNLRNTAVMRLLNKPIYAIYVLKENEKINEVLSKFFVYSSKKSAYANLGIHGGKGDIDTIKNIYYNRMNDSYKLTKDARDCLIRIRYGYYSDGVEMKLITEQKGGLFGSGAGYMIKGIDGIIALRRMAMFYGSGKDRRRLENYMELDDEYLLQFGIERKIILSKKDNILSDYHRSNKVKYFKAKLNKKRRLHVAFMRLDEWTDYVSQIYDREMNIEVQKVYFNNGFDNIYCVAYSVEDLGKVDKVNDRRLLHKKIVIDRMIERPTVVGKEYLDYYSMKEKRLWFFWNWNELMNNGMGRWDNFNISLESEEELWKEDNILEKIIIYKVRKSKDTFMDRFIKRIFRWIESR